MTLLPGLADMHIHLRYLGNSRDNPRLLELLLANGVTTAMNLLGLPEHLTLRKEIDSGRVAGPVLYTSGFYVNEPYVRTAEQVDSVVRAQARAGYDVVKIHGELSAPAFEALHRAAAEMGIPVVGHAVHALGLTALLDRHQYAIAHTEEYLYAWFGYNRQAAIPGDSVRPLIDEAARLTARAGTWVMPTLVVFQHIVPQITSLDSLLASGEVKALPAAIQAEWASSANPYANRVAYPVSVAADFRSRAYLLSLQTLALQKAGVRLVLGTDAGVPGTTYGFSVHDELAALVASGLTSFEALRTATSNAAAFVAGEEEFGTVQVGRRADLLLVLGDPLVDLGVIRKPVGVMVRGQWLDRAELDRMIGH
ncbi:MAG: amidohydrolase family protein [Gemmatimonadota bacterium]